MNLCYYTSVDVFRNIMDDKVLWLQTTKTDNNTELNLDSEDFIC